MRRRRSTSFDQRPLLPPPALRSRVAGSDDAGWFVESGKRSVADIERMLKIIGTDFTDYPNILDFGCGPGRILLALERIAADVVLLGTDIDAEAVLWAQTHIAYARVMKNDHLPPLPIEDESIDLVFNHSVFTHIDEEYQDAWLGELLRVTRRAGVVLLSVNGEKAFYSMLPNLVPPENHADAKRVWQEAGFMFFPDDAWVGGPFPSFYHTAVHAPWYVFRHWSKYFEIVAHVPSGSLQYQDFVLMRRSD
jgi:SAM-dependent methyltransferase